MTNKSSSSFPKILKIIGKIISWAIFCILILIACFLLYYFIATKIYAAKGPGYEPKFSIYTIVSPSMTPNINVYDTIVNIHVDDPNEIKVGDVITFISTSLLNPGTTVTHRVVAITKDIDGKTCYTTKGDYNPVEDQACAKFSNVLGKVIFKIPQLGRLQFFLASKAGWLLCILIPALYIIGRDIFKIFKLNSLKGTAEEFKDSDNIDPKKQKEEEQRKIALKRKLLKEEIAKEYSQEENNNNSNLSSNTNSKFKYHKFINKKQNYDLPLYKDNDVNNDKNDDINNNEKNKDNNQKSKF